VIKTLKPPIKIFGNIHGDYIDLMRFLDIWGSPSESGDISGFDYLFLGNYVDKGCQSLEVICLLMALKLKYPKQIFMLRGNHEDRNVNKYLGLGQECNRRLGEDINDPNSIFQKLNDMFEYLPMAAIVNDKSTNNKVFCVHAGISATNQKVEDIEKIQRPLKITLGQINNETQQMAMDLLWSDPAINDDILGAHPNLVRDPTKQNNMSVFGADIVDKFLKLNQLQLMIRGNQVCQEGIDRFAGGQCITINSCTNYCNVYNNDASILVVQKKLVISPKIIKPSQNGCQWL
jgi:protein phosphatase